MANANLVRWAGAHAEVTLARPHVLPSSPGTMRGLGLLPGIIAAEVVMGEMVANYNAGRSATTVRSDDLRVEMRRNRAVVIATLADWAAENGLPNRQASGLADDFHFGVALDACLDADDQPEPTRKEYWRLLWISVSDFFQANLQVTLPNDTHDCHILVAFLEDPTQVMSFMMDIKIEKNGQIVLVMEEKKESQFGKGHIQGTASAVVNPLHISLVASSGRYQCLGVTAQPAVNTFRQGATAEFAEAVDAIRSLFTDR